MNNEIYRRTFLKDSGVGLGAAAFGTMVGADSLAANPSRSPSEPLTGFPNLPAKAKRVIFLCMAGGPSHLETFDYKEKLAEMDGRPMPESFTAGQPIAQLQGQELKCLGPLTKFRHYGESGQTISDFLPWHAKMADDICIIKSLVTEQINHDPAHTFMNTGTALSGRPSMGSWITYGLGTETQNLPGFVVLTSVGGRNPQPIASRQWSAGFLPSEYQGVEFSSTGDPVHYVRNPRGVDQSRQRSLIDAVRAIDSKRNEMIRDPEVEARLKAYELAFRMQTSVPELMDVSDESQETLDMYGAKPGDGSYASNCLLARRLAERGVRFIHLYHRGWDHHGGLVHYMNICCGLTDQPTWALLTDLKQRGMLEDTLVVWGGEFGRTPIVQGSNGRDHNPQGFTMWLAGGGVKGGLAYGETDEFGYYAVRDKVHMHDLHATILHLLGIDHLKLTYRYAGRDFRLTDVYGEVVKGIFA
ncbi:MAG: DUF1501 domain-containing protein [Planctomycetales bacterium]|nr:DUF1501 domain-containing protein [Planctomycetales bacterium]